jgi:hypothetical protein
MEPLIVDAAPKGSAILAYGTAPKSRFHFIWMGGISLVGLLALATLAVIVLLRSIPLPPHRLITIAAAPAKIGELLSTEQISDLPPSWRAAVRTGKKSPALFGISLGENGDPSTFAFVFGSASPSDGVSTVHQTFRTLLVDASSTAPERVSIFRVLPLLSDLRHADASWSIGADELRAFVGTVSEKSSDDIRGRWANGRGELDLSAPGTNAKSDPSPFIVVLGGDKEGSALVKSAFIAQGIDIRSVSAPIAEAAFSPDSALIRASFVPPIGVEDARTIRAAFGQSGPRISGLSDATPIEEIVLPTSTDSADQTSFVISDATGTSRMESSVPCEGSSILRLEGPVLANTMHAVGIPESLAENIHAFVMTQGEGKTTVCIQ